MLAALRFNRRLWTFLVTAVTRDQNELPVLIKQNLANLGVYILSHSIQLEAAPVSDRFGVLVSLNREIAAGLRAMPAPIAA